MVAYTWPADEPGAIVVGGGGYVVPRGGEALVGATMEFVGFDAGANDAGRAHLAGVAARIYPTLQDAPIRRAWAGLRPGTPDGHPIIGQDSTYPNLWYATGHGRNGVLLAPITGDVITHLVLGNPIEQLEIDLTPVRPSRFWDF
jgi:glycine/D-amino acid oxidase-like deaminating enzyme